MVSCKLQNAVVTNHEMKTQYHKSIFKITRFAIISSWDASCIYVYVIGKRMITNNNKLLFFIM